MSSESHGFGHVIPYRVFFYIGSALIVLTGITIYAAQIDFGSAAINITIAMTIASIKVSLVVLWFMHLKYENVLTWIYIIFPFVLLAILIGFTLGDELLRIIPEVLF